MVHSVFVQFWFFRALEKSSSFKISTIRSFNDGAFLSNSILTLICSFNLLKKNEYSCISMFTLFLLFTFQSFVILSFFHCHSFMKFSHVSKIASLTHLFPMHSSSTPYKHQKIYRFSYVFNGQRKGALETNRLTLMRRSF